jgi:hypothetical protein
MISRMIASACASFPGATRRQTIPVTPAASNSSMSKTQAFRAVKEKRYSPNGSFQIQ